MRRYLWLFCLLLVGCGDGGEGPITGGQDGSAAGPTTVGVVRTVAAGTGPVFSQAQADTRVLTRYLGLPAGRLRALDQPSKRSIEGLQADPLVAIYRVPGPQLTGSHPPGTTVSRVRGVSPDLLWTADRAVYLYYVDPEPLARDSHPAFVVSLGADDGTILEITTDFAPLVNNAFTLDLPTTRADNLVYIHADLARAQRLAIRMLEQALPLAKEATASNTSDFVGYGFQGAADLMDGSGVMEYARQTYTSWGGTSWSQRVDSQAKRTSEKDFASGLFAATADMKPEGKLFLFISSHGTATSIGLGSGGFPVRVPGGFQAGEDIVSWPDLCFYLSEIPPKNICLVLDTCYAGGALIDLAECGKRVTVVTASGANSIALTAFSPVCILTELQKRVKSLAQGAPVTSEHIRQAFAGLSVSTADQDKKNCSALEQLALEEGLTPAEATAFKQRTYTTGIVGAIAGRSVGPSPSPSPSPQVTPSPDASPVPQPSPSPLPSPSPTVTPRPSPVETLPGSTKSLLDRWESGLQQGTFAGLYPASYNYNGQNQRDLQNQVSGQRVSVRSRTQLRFLPRRGADEGDSLLELSLSVVPQVVGLPGAVEIEGTTRYGHRITLFPAGLQFERQARTFWELSVRTPGTRLIAPEFPRFHRVGLGAIDLLSLDELDFDTDHLSLAAGATVRLEVEAQGLTNPGGTVTGSLGGSALSASLQAGTWVLTGTAPRTAGRYRLEIQLQNQEGISDFHQSVRGRSFEVLVQ